MFCSVMASSYVQADSISTSSWRQGALKSTAWPKACLGGCGHDSSMAAGRFTLTNLERAVIRYWVCGADIIYLEKLRGSI